MPIAHPCSVQSLLDRREFSNGGVSPRHDKLNRTLVKELSQHRIDIAFCQQAAKSHHLRNTLRVSMKRYDVYDKSALGKVAAGCRESRDVSLLVDADGCTSLRGRAEHHFALVQEGPDRRVA